MSARASVSTALSGFLDIFQHQYVTSMIPYPDRPSPSALGGGYVECGTCARAR